MTALIVASGLPMNITVMSQKATMSTMPKMIHFAIRSSMVAPVYRYSKDTYRPYDSLDPIERGDAERATDQV